MVMPALERSCFKKGGKWKGATEARRDEAIKGTLGIWRYYNKCYKRLSRYNELLKQHRTTVKCQRLKAGLEVHLNSMTV